MGPVTPITRTRKLGLRKLKVFVQEHITYPIALYKDNNNNNNKNAFLDLFSYSESQPTDNEFVQVFNISCMIFSFVQCMLCVYVCVRVHI